MPDLWELQCTDRDESGVSTIGLRDPTGMYLALIQAGGCIHLYLNYYPGDFEDWASNVSHQYIHVHLDKPDLLIERLQALREIAKKEFGDDWA